MPLLLQLLSSKPVAPKHAQDNLLSPIFTTRHGVNRFYSSVRKALNLLRASKLLGS